MGILIIYLVFIYLCVFGIKQKSQGVPAPLFSLHDSKVLRGICATEILIGHVGQIVSETYLLPFEKAMICSVGMFFCLSGYGLMDSILVKPNYLKRFYKRYISIGVPVVFCATFTFILQGFHIDFFEAINWYIIELVVFYTIFYIIVKIFGFKYLVLILFGVTSFGILLLYFGGAHKSWFVSSLCFVLGIGLKEYENSIINLINKYYLKSLLISIALLGSTMLYSFYPERNFFDSAILRNISTLSFCCLVLLVVRKIQIGNRCSIFFGKYSMGIYLYHIAAMWALLTVFEKNNIQTTLVFLIVLFIISLGLAMLFSVLENRVKIYLIGLGEKSKK